MLETICGENGQIWFVVNGKCIMYMSENGTLHVEGDVVAFAKLPPIPTKHGLCRE